MEGQAEGLVGLLGALVVEEVLDDVVPDREEGAARRIGRGVDAVGASDAAGERSCATACQKVPRMGRNGSKWAYLRRLEVQRRGRRWRGEP